MTEAVTVDQAGRCRDFRSLHASGCFVIPNPWDAGSARVLAGLGFKALATTSSGFAWSRGRRDGRVTLEEALSHFALLAAEADVPVSADFQNGFAAQPEQVERNVTRAAMTGIAGLSIEDSSGDPAAPLYDFALAVERVRAARRALDAHGQGLVLTARSEGFIAGRPDLAETIRRLQAFALAGADCLFAPGLPGAHEIREVVRAVAPRPVNVLDGGAFTFAELRDLGVRRISVGGALARAAWTTLLEAAQEIAVEGRFTLLRRAASYDAVQKLFSE
jgi:2-methylisocitrate lyase-like PEP mutase family enzyme